MLRGVTFDEQIRSSKDEAMQTNYFYQGNEGVMSGCVVTKDTEKLMISEGYLMMAGRLIKNESVTNVSFPAYTDGTMYCALVCEIDLTQINTASECKQLSFKILTDGSTYPSLRQDDLINGGTVRQRAFTLFTITSGGVSGLTDVRDILNLNKYVTDAELDTMIAERFADSGWITVASFSSATWSGTILYRKFSGIVYVDLLNMKFDGTPTLPSDYIPLTLPAGYRPSHDINFIVHSEETDVSRKATVQSDGDINIAMKYASNSSFYWCGSVSYPV